MSTLGHALTIARRELRALLGQPVAALVAALFLVVQGLSFWAVLSALADPRNPAPYGAVLRTHFGGTFLYWAFLTIVAVALTMRAIAEERRQGTWEVLCAAPVSDLGIVLGKWLGALGFYAVLWLPTLAYPAILRALAPAGAAPDAGPILSAYLGVLVTGASFLAVGLAASAAVANQLAAAFLGAVLLLGWVLFSTLPESAPAAFEHGLLGTIARAVDVRAHMDDFARGLVDSRHVGVHAGVTLVALAAAVALAGQGRRTRAATGRAALGVALVAACALLAQVEVARHPRRVDLTASRVYTLEGRTRALLAELEQPVRVLILRAQAPEFAGLYDEVDELLRQFRAAQPLVELEHLDPDLEPGRVTELASAYQLAPDELTGGGAVVFLSGERHRAVALLDVAEFDRGQAGAVLRAFRGEAAFAAALAEVSDPSRPTVCLTQGHGELPLAASASRQDLSAFARQLDEDGFAVETLADLAAGIPARCAAVAILGPSEALPASDAAALVAALGRGARLLVALDGQLDDGTGRAPVAGATPAVTMRATGLETVLAGVGIALPPAIVLDPEHDVGIPLSWGTVDGYAAHPITSGFVGRRLTVWFAPRRVEAAGEGGAVTLVRAGDAGVTVTDLARLREASPPGQPGPAGVAAAAETPAGARVVVLGSARALTSEVLARDLGGVALLARSSLGWLSNRAGLTGAPPKTPEQFRVVLEAGTARRLFVICVVILPGLVAALAAWLLVRTRKERA